ncbi:collagen alpha-2(I) chain-like [Haliotis cracherodii]|uniref:collagen alpha-2(I) chain-like n=1 Tax=Haliotis cracherodii TaxID=6455 RepID=UPI0039E940DD
MSKLTIVAFLVIVGILAINSLRIRPIYDYGSPDYRLIPGRDGHHRLVRVYERPDKPDQLVITQGHGSNRRTFVSDNVDHLYDHPMMGAHALSSHHAYSTLGKRKRRSILHPFHPAALFHPLLARNHGLNLALRARTLGALSLRNRLLGARGLLGQRLVRPVNVAQIATQVGHHKTPAAVTRVATKQAPQIIPSAPAVVLTKGVDTYPAPADVYQPGPGVNTGIPNHIDQVGLPYEEIFDQPAGGQPLYQPPSAGINQQGPNMFNDPAGQPADLYNGPGAPYNGPAGQPADLYNGPGAPYNGPAGQPADLYNGPAGQPADLYNGPGAPYNGPAGQPADLYNGPAGQPADLYNGPGAPYNGPAGQPADLYNGPAGQPADLYNGPGAPYNDLAGAQTYPDPLGSGPIYQGTNGASDIFRNGIDVYSTDLGGGFGPSRSNLGLGDYLLDSNGQNSVIFDSNNPSNMAASGAPTGTAGPSSAPSFM